MPKGVVSPRDPVEWSRETMAWIAGILEGEGSFVLKQGARTSRKYPVIQCGMTDRDIIDRLRQATGVGTICASPRTPPRKDAWVWSVQRGEHAAALMVALWPWMGDRRKQQIRECLTGWFEQPLSENHWVSRYA